MKRISRKIKARQKNEPASKDGLGSKRLPVTRTVKGERDLLRLLVDSVPAMVAYIDTEQRYVYCNRHYCEAFGVHYKEMVGRPGREILGEDLYRTTQANVQKVLAGEEVQYERLHRWKDGRTAVMAVKLLPHADENGRALGYIVVLNDITEDKRAEAALRESESRLRTIADHLPALVAYVDRTQTYRFANRTYQDWMGIDHHEIVGRTMRQVLGARTYAVTRPHIVAALAGDTAVHERELALSGKALHLHNVYVPHFGEHSDVQGFFVLATDVSERKAMEIHLARIAQQDPLTGLPNRTLLDDRLHRAIARSRRTREQVAVMYIDIDHFKEVNDTRGHNAGDELLKAFAGRIRQCVRDIDTVARLGGDEFVVLLEDITRPEDAVLVAEKIVASMREPFELENAKVPVTASIGIAVGNGSELSTAHLLHEADVALYQAKAGGRNTFRMGERKPDRRRRPRTA